MAVALVVLWPSVAFAGPLLVSAIVNTNATVRDDKAADAAATSLAEQLSEARMQLQQTTQARTEAGRRTAGHPYVPLQSDKQRLLDWLVDLQQEKVKRLEELNVLQLASGQPAETDPLVKALQGPPPYAALQVDALRDEIDGLREKLAAAEASHRANQGSAHETEKIVR